MSWEDGVTEFDHFAKRMVEHAVQAPLQKVAEGDLPKGKYIASNLDPTTKPTPYKLWAMVRGVTQTFNCEAEWKGDAIDQGIIDACRSLQPK